MAEEVENLRKHVYQGNDTWLGWRSFLEWSANAPSYSKTLENQPFPGISGPGEPLCDSSTAIYNPQGANGRERGVALIVAHYETPRNVDRATLRIRGFGKETKLLIENGKDGKLIEGPVPGKEYNVYAVVEGSNVVVQRTGLAILSTAADADGYNPAEVMRFFNTVNEASTPNLLGAQPEELWMIDIQQRQVFGGSLVYTDYYMVWMPEPEGWKKNHEGQDWHGWNSQLYSQLGTWVVDQIPVYNNGVLQPKYREGRRWLPYESLVQAADGTFTKVPSEPELRQSHEPKDWSQLNAKEIFFA